ncbi:MAG: Fic family protein, partial [Clostridia bacterium]|nr:Fic family protein [Clostridia bacterium]
QILDFHVRFEQIFPFGDGNGRIGRLIMFKECLRHGVMPFILDDKKEVGLSAFNLAGSMRYFFATDQRVSVLAG